MQICLPCSFLRFGKINPSSSVLSPLSQLSEIIDNFGSYFHFLDVPKEISNKEILENDLPFAKATIRETCTLVAATRARFNQILIPTNRRYAFSKQYGDHAELKITFPAGVTEKILILNVQVMGFPAVTYE